MRCTNWPKRVYNNIGNGANICAKRVGWMALPSVPDYCFNAVPFFSPRMFRQFITPYLKALVAGYKEQGYYVIKHTDGNLMPVLDQIAECEPHGLHSIDCQAKNMDMAVIKAASGR